MSARLIRKFVEVLGLLDRGRFEDACNEALTDAVGALEQLPKEKGKATITVTLELTYEKGLFNVLPVVKTKLPEGDAFGRTPFWGHEGALSTQHPSQIDMFARGVSTEAQTTAQSG